jgi:hypothetical protein
MNKLPKRTGKTHLTHDELIILDFLALQGAASIGILNREDYPVHMNSPYTHNFSDKQLAEKMSEWIMNGWITQEEDCTGYIYYAMTLKGGDLWECERVPQWEKYCVDSLYLADDDQHWWLEILCRDREIGFAFANVALACGLFAFHIDELQIVEAESENFVYWKPVQDVWAWKVLMNKEEKYREINWDLYEKRRIWWSTLEELQKFVT